CLDLMAGPDISVVLATYNRAALLPRAIASVFAQDGVDFELIIVDDASTDSTRDYLATLADPRVRIVTVQSNLGPSGARNRGLAATRAPVVAFLDSGDRYRPGRLAAPLAALADADVVCVLSSALRFDRGTPREARVPDVTLRREAFEWALICDLVPVEASSMTVRRDDAVAAGGFCPTLRLAEDREVLVRVARRGGRRLLPGVLWGENGGGGQLGQGMAQGRSRPRGLPARTPRICVTVSGGRVLPRDQDPRVACARPPFRRLVARCCGVSRRGFDRRKPAARDCA